MHICIIIIIINIDIIGLQIYYKLHLCIILIGVHQYKNMSLHCRYKYRMGLYLHRKKTTQSIHSSFHRVPRTCVFQRSPDRKKLRVAECVVNHEPVWNITATLSLESLNEVRLDEVREKVMPSFIWCVCVVCVCVGGALAPAHVSPSAVYWGPFFFPGPRYWFWAGWDEVVLEASVTNG